MVGLLLFLSVTLTSLLLWWCKSRNRKALSGNLQGMVVHHMSQIKLLKRYSGIKTITKF